MSFADYPIEYCTHCGRQLKPLATTMYCPGDCDRKPTVELQGQKTDKFTMPKCPRCQSIDTLPFWPHGRHCVDCGKVF